MASGAGTDHLAPSKDLTLEEVEAAYEEQCSFVEGEGSQIILMASRALAACAKGPEDYERVYRNILSKVSEPVILHWLGDMFDPALQGYWGHEDIDKAMEVCLRVIKDNEDKVDGIKISLLDAQREIDMRRLLPESVKMYTGDDFNYPELIRGDEQGYSHALLGIFDAIAPAASAALHALDAGDLDKYEELLEKTVPLSRHIFQTPTYAYKDRKSTRLNSSHVAISYAVFCLKKKSEISKAPTLPPQQPAPRTPAPLRLCQPPPFSFFFYGARHHPALHSFPTRRSSDLIAPAASAALHALDAGDLDKYEELLEKTVPLSRHIFQTPTYAY